MNGMVIQPSEDRYLFGMGSARHGSRVDYANQESARWNDEQQGGTLNIKTGSLNQAEFQKLQDLYREQKIRVEHSNRALRNKQVAALNFASMDELAQLAKKATNSIQINDYNGLRHTNTAMYHADHKKKDYSNTKSFAVHNEVLGTKSPATQLCPPSRGSNRDLALKGNAYKSADGTIYRHSVDANNVLTEEIDPPTKNVIHVPGKYHELYRQSVHFDEIPQNIKHKFRTNNTKELLKDELKVHDTLAKIYNNGVNKKHNRDVEQGEEISQIINSKTQRIPVNKQKDYDDLGNLLRHSVQRGRNTIYTMGHVKEVHNDEVSKLFLSNQKNIDSPWRRKTDWLVEWQEDDFIGRNLNKELEKLFADRKMGLLNKRQILPAIKPLGKNGEGNEEQMDD